MSDRTKTAATIATLEKLGNYLSKQEIDFIECKIDASASRPGFREPGRVASRPGGFNPSRKA